MAKTNCRNLSQLYETRTNTETLYFNLENCILESSKGDNAIHLVLARLLKDWQKICDRQDFLEGPKAFAFSNHHHQQLRCRLGESLRPRRNSL